MIGTKFIRSESRGYHKTPKALIQRINETRRPNMTEIEVMTASATKITGIKVKAEDLVFELGK